MPFMKTLAIILLAAVGPQEDKAVADAAAKTFEKGSFTAQITPKADLKDAMPKDRAAVAGVTILSEELGDGLWHATDGTWELYGNDAAAFMKDGRQWTPAKDVIADLVAIISGSMGENEWKRRNVRDAKEAYAQLIAIAQLIARGVPAKRLLTGLAEQFKTLKSTGTEVVDGKKCTVYEGELKDQMAHDLLLGPYDFYVKSGVLTIAEFAGSGRVWVDPDGLIRRTKLRAAGKYVVVNKAENTTKTTPVAIEVGTDYVKIGTTTRKVPTEVRDRIEAATPGK